MRTLLYGTDVKLKASKTDDSIGNHHPHHHLPPSQPQCQNHHQKRNVIPYSTDQFILIHPEAMTMARNYERGHRRHLEDQQTHANITPVGSTTEGDMIVMKIIRKFLNNCIHDLGLDEYDDEYGNEDYELLY